MSSVLRSANEGHLYPLEKQFIFIHKPAVLIRFDEIESVEFQRYAGAGQGSTRNFDLCVTLHTTPGDNLAVKEYTFSGIDKTNYNALYSFLSGKKIRIKNIEGAGGPDDQAASGRGAGGALMYDERDAGDDMGESSDDEDYGSGDGSGESSGSDSEEDDDDMGSVVSDDSDLAEHRKTAKKEAKKKKEKSSDAGEGKKESKKEKEKASSKKRKESSSSSKKAASPKKKKAKKDPNAPKKPKSGETSLFGPDCRKVLFEEPWNSSFSPCSFHVLLGREA